MRNDDVQDKRPEALAEATLAVPATPSLEGSGGLQNVRGLVASQSAEEATSNRIIDELARVAETVERQGTDQQKILVDIFHQLKLGTASHFSDPKKAEKGKEVKGRELKQGSENRNQDITGILGNEKGKQEPKKTVSSRPVLSESTPNREITVKTDTTESEKGKKEPEREKKDRKPDVPVPAVNTAVQARERRTVTLGDAPPAPLVATPAPAAEPVTPVAGPVTPREPKATEDSAPPKTKSRADGFYLGDDGRVRTPDGRFANRVETRRFNRDNGHGNDGNEEEAGSTSMLAKAIAQLTKKGDGLAGTEAGDSAGVAVGNTFWLAAKEAKGMADELRDSLQERGINNATDAKSYAKDKAQKVWGAIKNPFGRKPEAEATTSTSEPATQPTPDKPGIGEQKNQEQTDAAREEVIRRKERAETQEQHQEVTDRLDTLIEESKPQKKGLVDLATDRMKDSIFGDRDGGRKGKKGRTRGKGKGKARISSAGSETGRRTTSRQQGPERTRAGRTAAERTPRKGSTELSSSRREPARGGRKGRMPRLGTPTGPSALAGGFKGTVATRGAGAATGAKNVGRVARAAAAIPRVGAPLASVATMSGMTGGALTTAASTGRGAIAAGRGVLAAGGRGALALGGRAIPLIGAAMTAYDAYNGFNDEEGQRRVFGLDQDKGPSTGQKSAMAAGQVLDMGGLTSGLSGLLASGAGALGMTNLQDSLSFDSDDIARKVYDVFSNDKALKKMGVKDGESGSVGQNVAATVAKVVDMGGMVSGTTKLLGGIAEDLGFDGAKESLTFDTEDLAESLYNFFGPILGDKKKQEPVVISNSTARYDTPTARQNITEADVKQAGKQYDFSEVEQANGLPTGFMNAMAGVESGGNPLAYNKSGAKGMFQLMPDTAASLGVSNPYDVKQSANAAAKLATDNARYFTKQTGRVPEGRELYLLHQQGMGGGTALANNPEMSAVDALTKGGQKNASKAILQNGGTLNMTAKEFGDMIMAKYDKQFTAQSMAREKGAKALPMEKATETAVEAVVGETPNMLLNKPAAVSGTAGKGVAVAESVNNNSGGVTDIQQAQARADMAKPAGAELTAVMDPRMAEVMAKLDKTLNGMSSGTGENKPGTVNNTTNNTTNNFHGQSRGVGDHDMVSWPNKGG